MQEFIIYTQAIMRHAFRDSGRVFAAIRLFVLALVLVLVSGLSNVLSAQSAGSNPSSNPNRKLSFVPISNDFAKDLPDNLNAAQKAKLLASAEITLLYDGAPSLSLSPSPKLKDDLAKDIKAISPTLGIESLLIYPLPKKIADDPGRELVLYNLLHRFKSMEGIQYWSDSRQQMRIFFIKSSLVKNQQDRSAIADPVFTAVEPYHQLSLQQEDSSFGNNLYAVDVRSWGAGAMSLRMTNLEQVWYGIAPVLGPKSLSMTVYVETRGNLLIFYGSAGINAATLFGLGEKAKTSFYNRILALYDWYTRELDRAGQ